MSLVNDLIIEVDRRNRESAGLDQSAPPDSPIDGLSSPQRTRPAPPTRDWLRISVAGLAVGAIGLSAILLHAGPSRETIRSAWVADESGRTAGTSESARAAVSAAVPQVEPADAQVAVRSVSMSRMGEITRIRFLTDQQGKYQIDGAGEGQSIRVVLENAKLDAPLPALDLGANGLNSWQVVEEDGALVMRIEVPQSAPVQSQWIAATGGAALFVDLLLPVTHAEKSAQTASRPADVASPGAWLDRPAALRPPESVDREPAATGLPGEMEIARSRDDHDRSLQKNARNAADRVLRQARFARSEGDLPGAAKLYASGLDASPGHRALTLERTRLLLEMNEPENALALIRESRREDPRDVAFAMLHARLLERMGDLTSALSTLQDSPFDLAEAPEIFALTAAYLQKSGDHATAIEKYEALVRRFPDQSGWWMGLGISLEARARTQEALGVYEIALELGALPETSRAWVSGRVRSLKEKG